MPLTFVSRRKKSPLDDPMVSVVPRGPGWAAFAMTVAGLALILWAAWHLAGILIATTNQSLGPQDDPASGEIRGDQDQKHYLNRALLARPLLESDPQLGITENVARWWPHETDGVAAPLWPWVAAHYADKEHLYKELQTSGQDRAFFVTGKWINVWIALGFAAAFGLSAAKSFRPGAAIAVLLLGVFGALLPRSVYFRPETLYYILFFLSWLCAVRLLLRNSVWLHGIFGVLAGLAYLAKASIEPLILAWAGVSLLRALLKPRRSDGAPDDHWTRRNFFFGILAFAIGWFAVCTARYNWARDHFGDARFTWPEHWQWMDDFPAAARWMHEHKDAEKLAAIPENEWPSFNNYRRTHTPQQMWDRLRDGWNEKITGLFCPRSVRPADDGTFTGWKHILDWRGWYMAGATFVFLTAALAAWSRRKAPRIAARVPGGGSAAALFVIVTFAGYAALYGWYTPIGRGDRFMLALYLPLAFTLIWGAESLTNLALMRGAGKSTAAIHHLLLWTLNAAIILRIIEVLRHPVFDPATQ